MTCIYTKFMTKMSKLEKILFHPKRILESLNHSSINHWRHQSENNHCKTSIHRIDHRQLLHRKLNQKETETTWHKEETIMKYSILISTSLTLFLGLTSVEAAWGFGDSKADKVLLKDIQVLTLHAGRSTTGTCRSFSYPWKPGLTFSYPWISTRFDLQLCMKFNQV